MSNINIMSNWVCKNGYDFKLYPKIGTWGCYDSNGNFSSPINIDILLILICIILFYFIYRKHNKKKNNK